MDAWQLKSKAIVGRSEGPHLLITGGVHGDEWEPMAAARRLLAEIDPAQVRGRITIVPVVNEPAFERGKRTADDELDLARTCPGRDDGSVTQRIAAALSRLIRTADYYIDLHTAGTVFQMLPLAGYVLHTDPNVLATQRTMARAFGLPIVWGTNGRLDGRSLSIARDAGVPAIYVENGGGGTCDPRRVDENVRGCLNVARAVGLLPNVQAEESGEASIAELESYEPRYFVEDDRDASGHLQVQSQAPVAGYFDPVVELGDTVERGQSIGCIVDPLGGEVVEIPAYDSGTVLLLRTFPSVRVGDPLVVLLPITGPGTATFLREPQQT
jgi:predicted deacylase